VGGLELKKNISERDRVNLCTTLEFTGTLGSTKRKKLLLLILVACETAEIFVESLSWLSEYVDVLNQRWNTVLVSIPLDSLEKVPQRPHQDPGRRIS